MARMIHFAWAVLAAIVGLSNPRATLAGSDNEPWPTFHGPVRDNLARETGLLKQWPDGGPRLLWKFSDGGRGYACVSIAQGLLFTSGDFGDQEYVLALDLEGRLKWKTPNGKAWKGAQPGARTTPPTAMGWCITWDLTVIWPPSKPVRASRSGP